MGGWGWGGETDLLMFIDTAGGPRFGEDEEEEERGGWEGGGKGDCGTLALLTVSICKLFT